MEASILDLRYNMHTVLKALDRLETVKILYHNKLKGFLVPFIGKPQKTKKAKVRDHPFFGINKKEKISVHQTVRNLRKPRYDF